MTDPLYPQTGCVLSKKAPIPSGRKTALKLIVGHHPEGDWTLIVRADGKELFETSVAPDTAEDGWREVRVDLSKYAGKEISLELVNQPSGWAWEAGYWTEIKLVSD